MSIKVKELYDFILSKMPAEEALMKMLEAGTIQYESLKFPEGEDKTPVHPVIIITMAAVDMGWDLAIDKDAETVEGLVVGTEEYLGKMLGK
jgi:hypothetical protein